MNDDALKAMKEWMKRFQGLSLDADGLDDLAQAAEKVGGRLRGLSGAEPFGGQPSPFTKILESFAQKNKKNG